MRYTYSLLLVMAFLALSPSLVAGEQSYWITLGTAGGPPLHADQAQISNAVVINDSVYLFDVGNSVLRQMAAARLPVRNLRAVFLSHHHPDHNADLGPVMMSWWLFGPEKPLLVRGPQGTEFLANGIADANAPTLLASFPTAGRPPKAPLKKLIEARDLPSTIASPTMVYEDENIRVSAIDVDHFQLPPTVPMEEMPQAVAYRVEVAGLIYVYSGDTGPSRKLQTLAEGADVLVTEVVSIEGIRNALRTLMPDKPDSEITEMANAMKLNHLTGQAIGEIASQAGVKHVVLTHFVPAFDSVEDPETFKNGIAPAYPGPIDVAHDLDRF